MSADDGYYTLKEALEYVPGEKPFAVEFGVYSGMSLGIIAERMPVVGFDSFEGLPEDWRPGFPKGKFNTGGQPPFRVPFNAMLVKGLFEDTAPKFPFPRWIDLVHIDCDLYSSTVTALLSVWAHLRTGTVIVFDEFHGYEGHEEHEKRAWNEFITRTNFHADRIASGAESAAFQITGWE